ncbi:MAG: zinc ABC transporter permease AztB [Acidimicrobiia bacterium]|nr:zinc ABC transporter permease AztB [Acidimicrobiia bacterium]
MDWLIDPFSLGFMQRALLAGLLAVITTSLVGTWVVLRGLSFLGDALAHGVLPGIALGVLLGFDLTIGAIASALAMVIGINLVHRYSRLSEDTGIGLLFVGMLAAGVVIISRTASYSGSLTGILFGDALGATGSDVVVLLIGALVALVMSVVLYRGFLALSFNEQKAQMLGLHPRFAHIAMLMLVTMAVVTSFRTVGTLLVFGLLVAPPAAATLVARRVPVMMMVATAVGGLSVLGGLLISYHANTAASATIAGLAVAIFFLVLTVRGVMSGAS